MALEKHSLTLGFIPLTDCAPIVVAHELGYFACEGLNVALSREASWATLRDKVTFGILDAAHMLAPMPIASTLGVSGFSRPLVTALSLGLNGNAITVSNALYARMLDADFAATTEPRLSAQALRKVLDADCREGREPMTFATVFPFSMHNYELRYWLAGGGIDPDRDVRMVVVPPPDMVSRLRAGSIDGFCVGEPWNLLARAEGVGRLLLTGGDIWSGKPEKVLAVSRDWAQQHPRTHQALLRALIRAACWLDEPVNCQHASAMLSQPGYIGVETRLIAASLPGGALTVAKASSPAAGNSPLANPSCFFAGAATFPWRSHAMWIVTQMQRWGQLPDDVDAAAIAGGVYDSPLYRVVATQLGIDTPLVDTKTEGEHAQPWLLQDATHPIAMSADRFIDGRVFNPNDCANYVRGFQAAGTQSAMP